MVLLIMSNIANIIIFALVISLVFACIYILKKGDAQKGCDGNCGSCPSAFYKKDDKPDIFDSRP